MPVPTKPNEQRLRRDNDFTWDQFAKDCLLNKYVLVVGNEAMLNRNVNPEAEGDSLKLLLELTIHELVQLNAIPDNRLDGCKSFNDLFKLNYSKDAIKEAVLNAIRGNDFYPQFDAEIEPSLMQLLETRCFRVVITTAIDPYLEIAMEKVWGSGGFDVIQIENAQQSFRQVTFDEFGVSRPLLCYVFGKADAAGQCAVNEHALGFCIRVGNVEKDLHHYAHGPHQHSGQDKGHHYAYDGKCRKQLNIQPLEKQGRSNCEHHGNDIGIGQFEKVHETGIAQDSVISLEETGSYPAENGKHRCGQADCNVIVVSHLCAVDHPISENRRCKNYGCICQQYNPVRQHLLAEVPVGNSLNDIHNWISIFCG